MQEVLSVSGFGVSIFFFLQLNLFFSVFHISPHPFRLRVLLFLFFHYLSIRPISLALSASASKCLEYASLCYILPYRTQNDAHLYFSKRRRLRLDALYHHYHHHHPIPPIQLLQHRRFYLPSIPCFHHCSSRCVSFLRYATSTYNYGHVSLFNRVSLSIATCEFV